MEWNIRRWHRESYKSTTAMAICAQSQKQEPFHEPLEQQTKLFFARTIA